MRIQPLGYLVSRLVVRVSRAGSEFRAVKVAAFYSRIRSGAPGAWVLHAGTLLSFGRLGEAEALLRRGLRRHPTSAEIANFLAWLLLRRAQEQGETSGVGEARQIFMDLERRYPSSAAPYVGLATLSQGMGSWDHARAFATKAQERLAATGESWLARYLGSTLLFVPGEYEAGLSLLRRAADDGDPEANLILAVTLEQVSAGEAAERLTRAQALWMGPLTSFAGEIERYRAAYCRALPSE